MGKEKKSKAANGADNADQDDDNTTEIVLKENMAQIAHPLAGKKLTKKILKTVKKGMNLWYPSLQTIELWCGMIASKLKHIKRGVKEVVKGLRKGEKG